MADRNRLYYGDNLDVLAGPDTQGPRTRCLSACAAHRGCRRRTACFQPHCGVCQRVRTTGGSRALRGSGPSATLSGTLQAAQGAKTSPWPIGTRTPRPTWPGRPSLAVGAQLSGFAEDPFGGRVGGVDGRLSPRAPCGPFAGRFTGCPHTLGVSGEVSSDGSITSSRSGGMTALPFAHHHHRETCYEQSSWLVSAA